MKVGDLVRNKQPGTTITHNVGLILKVYPNGRVMHPEMIVNILWCQGHQTVEFLKDFLVYYEVVQ